MRPPHRLARELLRGTLARQPGIAAAALAARLGVSVPTLHRLLHEQPAGIVAAGRARRTRYALARALRGSVAPLPLYEVQADGSAYQVAELALLQPQGSQLSLAGSHWPVPDAARDGWWDGLPYPLVDMRPQGYIGRQLALAEHRRLGVVADPEAWGDDDVVHVLSQVGSDTSGSLILGAAAFESWQQRKLQPPRPIDTGDIGPRYAELAELAVAQGVPGSSAAGEFPKFPALREAPEEGATKARPARPAPRSAAAATEPDTTAVAATPHVLVKFSGADGSPAVVRWADLLVCEHLALEAARALPGVTAARSRIVRHGGRTFLEVERFDRHGLFGRSPLVSLGTLDAALLGSGTGDWRVPADRLAAHGWLGEADRRAVHHAWWFGRLVANSDMHAGNLSFRPIAGRAGSTGRGGAPGAGALALAPLYDMLPMQHAPLRGGELPARRFEPPLPLPPERDTWFAACTAALRFWRGAAADERISDGFRALCAAAAARLAEVAQRV
ncbi:MAG: HipA domain-containing protein [Burkholderiales bacterium]|nr:HipA domain-containing protein [Burkholderiales bacterium]